MERSSGQTPRLRTVVTVQHATLLWMREQIATGALQPHDQLRQENLALEFGVSVPPVREALKSLEAEGLVVYAPHRGYFVAAMSAADLADNYRIRELLETEAIRRSVPALEASDMRRMREAIRDIEQASRTENVTALAAANRRFHFTLFEAAEMPRMTEIIRVLWEASDRYRSVYFSFPEHRRRVNAEHRQIMRAVSQRDPASAVKLLRAHREHALDSICSGLEAGRTIQAGAHHRQ